MTKRTGRSRGAPKGRRIPLADDPDLAVLAYIHLMSLGPKPNGEGAIGRGAAINNASVLLKKDLSGDDVRRLQKSGRLDFQAHTIDQLVKAEQERLKKKLGRLERDGSDADKMLLRQTALAVFDHLVKLRAG